MQQRHDLLHALGVQVRERFVEQEQLRLAHQGVSDEDALLLTTRETAEATVRETLGVDVVQDLLDQLALSGAAAREAVAMGVESERDEVARAHRDVGIDDDLLRHVAERTAARREGRTGDQDLAPSGRCSPRMVRSSVVLPTPLEPMSPGELARAHVEGDVVEDPAADQDSVTVTADRLRRTGTSVIVSPLIGGGLPPLDRLHLGQHPGLVVVARRGHRLVDPDDRDLGREGRLLMVDVSESTTCWL